MLPELDCAGAAKTREVGFYLHLRDRNSPLLRSVPAEDVLFNNDTSVERTVAFLCASKRVVTSSYHGVLWATYVNARVHLAYGVSEKFENLPFRLERYSEELHSKYVERLLQSHEPLVDGVKIR